MKHNQAKESRRKLQEFIKDHPIKKEMERVKKMEDALNAVINAPPWMEIGALKQIAVQALEIK